MNLISIIQNEIRAKETQDVIKSYLKKTGFPKKWVLLTDYCLYAQNKSNVITFVLLHYQNEDEYTALKQRISKLQKVDIKHTRYISNKLMRYLRKFPVFSFSFILDNPDILFGDTTMDQQQSVIDSLVSVKGCFQSWLKSAPSVVIRNYYQDSTKKLDAQIKMVSQGKKIRLHEDILLTACLGALYTAEILKGVTDLEIIGWLPDRDKITQSCNEIAIPLFHCLLYIFLGGRDIRFPVADPKIKGDPFYDDLNRIPDDICAAVADYDFSHPAISKEKFSHVLHELMADNPYVRVHRLYKDAKGIHFSTPYYKTNLWMSIRFYMQTALREVIGFVWKLKNLICQLR